MQGNPVRISIAIFAIVVAFSMVALPSGSGKSFSTSQLTSQNTIVYKNPDIAGYAILNTTNLREQEGTFKVPSLTCTESLNYTVDLAIELVSNSSTEHLDGARYIIAGVCSDGTLSSVALAGWGNGTSEGRTILTAPAAGDTIKVTITLSSSGDKIVEKDVTSGQSFSQTFQGASSNIAAWIGVSTIPVPKFSSIPFSGVEAAATGGKLQPIGNFSKIYEPVIYNSSDDKVLVQPTPLSKAGTGFSLVWKASS